MGLLLPFMALSGCGIHGLRVPQSPLLKLFVARSGHITFIGTDGNLYLADQSGKQTQLTHDAQEAGSGKHVTYVSPTWGPEGKRIAYARYLTNSSSGNSSVQFHILDWQTKKDIVAMHSTTLSPFYFDWSPDGRRLAILSDVGSGKLQMGVVAAGEPDSYQKLANGEPYYWTWSADGSEIIAHSDFTTASPGIVSVIPLTEPSKRTDLPGTFGLFQVPAALPNGNFVAVVTSGGAGSGARMAVIDPNTGAATPFAAPHVGGFLFSVSPDGKRVAYVETQVLNGRTASILHVWDLEEKKEVLSLSHQSTIGYYWSPDSSRIAFFTPASGTEKIDSSFAQVKSLPHVNLKVADVASGKVWNISTFPLTRGLLATFPFTDQFQQSQTIWSPNGRYLLFTAYTKAGVPGVFVADANGNVGPTKIADGDSAVWSWK